MTVKTLKTVPSARAARPRLEVVLVSYRSAALVAALLDRLPVGLPVVVVDNYGQDGCRDLVRRRAGARHLDGGGVGFARAANMGARTSQAQYLLFANPDTVPDFSVYEALVDEVAGDPRCASASALLVDGAGRTELGVAGWEPTPGRAVVHALGLHKLLPTRGLFARPAPGEHVDVDWTTGAALAVERDVFCELGGFDERFYVYNEDVAFGAAVRAAGLRQVLRTDLVVPHASGGSGAPALEMMRLKGASMAGYVTQRNARATSLFIRSVLAVGYSVRAGERRLRGDAGRAAEHVAYVRGVATVRASVGGRPVPVGLALPAALQPTGPVRA